VGERRRETSVERAPPGEVGGLGYRRRESSPSGDLDGLRYRCREISWPRELAAGRSVERATPGEVAGLGYLRREISMDSATSATAGKTPRRD
jgi:hypothetical protein